MKFYEVTYIVDDEPHERLVKLAEKYAKVNGWNVQELLQYAITAMYQTDIERKIQLLESQIDLLERECI